MYVNIYSYIDKYVLYIYIYIYTYIYIYIYINAYKYLEFAFDFRKVSSRSNSKNLYTLEQYDDGIIIIIIITICLKPRTLRSEGLEHVEKKYDGLISDR
jgi:hypothetical protein